MTISYRSPFNFQGANFSRSSKHTKDTFGQKSEKKREYFGWEFLKGSANLLQKTEILVRYSTGQSICLWAWWGSSGEINNMSVSYWIFVKPSLLMNVRQDSFFYILIMSLRSCSCKNTWLHAIKNCEKFPLSNQNLMYLQKVWTIPVMSPVFFNLNV